MAADATQKTHWISWVADIEGSDFGCWSVKGHSLKRVYWIIKLKLLNWFFFLSPDSPEKSLLINTLAFWSSDLLGHFFSTLNHLRGLRTYRTYASPSSIRLMIRESRRNTHANSQPPTPELHVSYDISKSRPCVLFNYQDTCTKQTWCISCGGFAINLCRQFGVTICLREVRYSSLMRNLPAWLC